jgi:hypothetical protein
MVERYGLQVGDEPSPVVLVTDLQVGLHDLEPAEKVPATVLGRPGVLVGDLDERGGDHVDDMIEPSSGRELPRRSSEFDEFGGRRPTSGGSREFDDLLGVCWPETATARRRSARGSDSRSASRSARTSAGASSLVFRRS